MVTTPQHENVSVFYYDGYKSLEAIRNFHQGEVILELPQSTMEGPDMYSLEVLPGIHVDCVLSPAGSINHSCDPTAAVRNGRIVAWKCIKEGDEITLDYKKTESKLAAPFDCNCGAKNCRGRIE